MTLTCTDKWQMMPRQITMSLDKRDCTCGTSQHGTYESFTSSGQSPLIFDPLDNGSPALHIDNQKVIRIDECQEADSEVGLGRSDSLHTGM